MTWSPPAPEYSQKWDVALTWLLLVVLFGFLLVLITAAGFMMDWLTCSLHPTDCNQGLYAAAYPVAIFGPVVIFIATVIVSLVRLARDKRGVFVPIIGAGAMVVCVAISALLLAAAKW